MKFRYTLEPYSSRRMQHLCPNCLKKEFVRYIHTDNGELLPEEFGRCNREIKCGYFRKPNSNKIISSVVYRNNLKDSSIFENLDSEILVSSQLNYEITSNPLCKFLMQYFEREKIFEILELYQVKSQLLGNQILTLFPLIDNEQKLRALKKMKYDQTTGKRHKFFFRWHNPQKLKLQQCLFGLHLLEHQKFKETEKVYIVESEKTAIIASLKYDNLLFMATGGLNNLTANRLRPVMGKQIILIPDLAPIDAVNNPYLLWKEKGTSISRELKARISINTMLLDISTDFQKNEQWDLADFIIKYNRYVQGQKL